MMVRFGGRFLPKLDARAQAPAPFSKGRGMTEQTQIEQANQNAQLIAEGVMQLVPDFFGRKNQAVELDADSDFVGFVLESLDRKLPE